jgi:hypothetical protein
VFVCGQYLSNDKGAEIGSEPDLRKGFMCGSLDCILNGTLHFPNLGNVVQSCYRKSVKLVLKEHRYILINANLDPETGHLH